MAKMTIKKWNTSLNSGNGDWEEHYPKTTQDMIYDSGSTTTSLFDSNKKLKVDYLPDAVFDSLYFQSTLDASANAQSFASVLQVAVEHAITNRQGVVNSDGTLDASPLGLEGYYFVVSTEGTINELQSSSQQSGSLSVGTGFNQYYFKWEFSRDDSGGGSTQPSSSGLMEVGDWIVVEKITGRGSSAQPFNIKFGVISNTYETMTGATRSGTPGSYTYTAGAKGLVPSPGGTDYDNFLKGDGTWAVPTDTNTFRTISVDTDGDGSANETLTATETLMLKKGSSITLAEASGVVTIGVDTEAIQDIVGGMVTSNTESGISVTYSDGGVGTGKLNFSVPEMVGGALNTAGTAGLAPAPGVADFGKFLRGDATYETPARRIVKINGTQEIASTSSTAADFINGLGVNVSATSGSGTAAGEVQFSMEYPIAVNATESNVSSYEVDGAIWFDVAQ